jgi:hypothetical protein
MHPTMRRARAWKTTIAVRVFNELGEVHCTLRVLPTDPARHREPAEGPWRRTHAQRRRPARRW